MFNEDPGHITQKAQYVRLRKRVQQACLEALYAGLIAAQTMVAQAQHFLAHHTVNTCLQPQTEQDGMLLGYHRDANPLNFLIMNRRQLSPRRRASEDSAGMSTLFKKIQGSSRGCRTSLVSWPRACLLAAAT